MEPLAAFQLLILTIAAAVAIEAFKKTGFERIAFGALFAVTALIGVLSNKIAAAWPAASDLMAKVGVNPITWLVVVTFVIILSQRSSKGPSLERIAAEVGGWVGPKFDAIESRLAALEKTVEPDANGGVDITAPAPGEARMPILTANEKGQAKDILVNLADAIRESWVPLFDSERWLSGSQDVYAQNLHALPALKEQAIQVTLEIHNFQNEHDHMLEIMGLKMVGLGQAAAGTQWPIEHYINRVAALDGVLTDEVIQLLQSDAEPVRDAFSLYNHRISHFQRTVTRKRKEIDA